MALIHRRRTGEGASIDLSQHEAGIQFLIPVLLERQLMGRTHERVGNRHPSFCPHGVYPCKGRERWVAIAVADDAQWKAFAEIVGENWVHEEAFASAPGRKQSEERIDALLSRWTQGRTAEENAKLLQAGGVPVGIVQNSQDLVRDPQLAHRDAIWYLPHEGAGRHAVYGQGFLLSKNPVPRPEPSPMLGEHTFYVCKEILHMADEEIARLLGEGVLQMMV
jgi:benzylsuccinate CoA-transferase BbsF subunit